MSFDSDEDDPFEPWVPPLKVWNCTKDNVPKDAVYVGRPTPFGNPVHLNEENKREKVVAEYEKWLLAQPELLKKVKEELKGKHLACWCAPKKCHADVLLRIANE